MEARAEETKIKYKQLLLTGKIKVSDLSFAPITCLSNEKPMIKSIDPVYGDNVFEIKIEHDTSVYTLNVIANTRIIVNTNGIDLTNRIITIELHLIMSTLSSVTLPINVRFASPIKMNELKTYVLVMRSINNNTEWIVNQAYSY